MEQRQNRGKNIGEIEAKYKQNIGKIEAKIQAKIQAKIEAT